MRYIILAGHANIAEGIAAAAEMIMERRTLWFSGHVDGDKTLIDKIQKAMDSFSADDEIIILTDLLGGRINNDMMRFLNDRRVHLVSGMNLGLVLQLYMYENEKIEEAIIEAIKDAKEGIQYCSDLDTFMEMDRFLGEDE